MAEEFSTCPCDKCGKQVRFQDDATLYESLVDGEPYDVLSFQARHLLPTEDCPGSPSRARYLKDQPDDPRGEYPWNDRRARLYREAWALVQEVTQGGTEPLTTDNLRVVEASYRRMRQINRELPPNKPN